MATPWTWMAGTTALVAAVGVMVVLGSNADEARLYLPGTDVRTAQADVVSHSLRHAHQGLRRFKDTERVDHLLELRVEGIGFTCPVRPDVYASFKDGAKLPLRYPAGRPERGFPADGSVLVTELLAVLAAAILAGFVVGLGAISVVAGAGRRRAPSP